MSTLFTSVDPTTGVTLATYEAHTPAEVAQRLTRAADAFGRWRREPLTARTALLERVADLLDARRDTYARVITDEMGKLLGDARAEIAKCATACRYYAEHAPRMLAPESVATEAAKSYVAFDPLGPVLAVMPWNFPFWQVFRFAAPAIVAGNVALLKHATNVCGAALAIEAVWQDAGAPAGVFQTLLVSAAAVAGLVADDRIRAVTLTGSEGAGISVAEAAGRVCKKCVLELGGSDAFIVLADADVRRAARAATTARLVNSGQSCIAAKRFIVVDAVAETFTRELTVAFAGVVVGDPRAADTAVGPLARADLRDELTRQVEAAIAGGARRLTGAGALPGPGFFYDPTILAEVQPGNPAFDEEVFGPVAAVVRAADDAEAVALANRSRYGLGASIWTRDATRAETLARELEAGMVFVNDVVRSDPRLPFGGVKRSGYGRELSHYGIREFVNVRTIVVGQADGSAEDSESVE